MKQKLPPAVVPVLKPLTLAEVKRRIGGKPKSAGMALKKIKRLFGNGRGWTKNSYGKLAGGRSVFPENKIFKKCISFCLMGAARRVDGPCEEEVIDLLIAAAMKAFPHRAGPTAAMGLPPETKRKPVVFNVNDHRLTKFADVVKVLDTALAMNANPVEKAKAKAKAKARTIFTHAAVKKKSA